MKQVANTTAEWKRQQEQTLRQQIEAEIAQAREDEDITAFEKAKDRLDAIPVSQDSQLPPVYSEFFQKHPILDKSKPEFSPEFYNDMAIFNDSLLDSLTVERRNSLTKDQVNRFMTLAYNKAKDLHPDKFKSPRNGRQAAPSAQKRGGQPPPTPSKLAGIKNPRNPRDTSPALDMYEMLKKTNPKAAETYYKNVIGD
jgi:hypothetical protein